MSGQSRLSKDGESLVCSLQKGESPGRRASPAQTSGQEGLLDGARSLRQWEGKALGAQVRNNLGHMEGELFSRDAESLEERSGKRRRNASPWSRQHVEEGLLAGGDRGGVSVHVCAGPQQPWMDPEAGAQEVLCPAASLIPYWGDLYTRPSCEGQCPVEVPTHHLFAS